MNRDQGLAILQEFVKNINLQRHMFAVEAAMRDYAVDHDEDPETWGLAGLLHDFDWEIHSTLEQHPQAGAPLLRERGVPEEIVRCILSHADHTGVPRTTLMDRALFGAPLAIRARRQSALGQEKVEGREFRSRRQ
jgi:putative nucleotidyltransferase with HDIG domain